MQDIIEPRAACRQVHIRMRLIRRRGAWPPAAQLVFGYGLRVALAALAALGQRRAVRASCSSQPEHLARCVGLRTTVVRCVLRTLLWDTCRV